MLIVVPVMGFIGVIIGKIMAEGAGGGVKGEDTEKELDPKEVAAAFSNEVLISIRSVKAMPSLLQLKLKEYDEKLEDILPMMKKTAVGEQLGFGMMWVGMFCVTYPLAIWFGGKLVDDGSITIGEFFECFV